MSSRDKWTELESIRSTIAAKRDELERLYTTERRLIAEYVAERIREEHDAAANR